MDALPALSLEALPERRVEPCGSPRASSQPSTRAKVPHSAVRDPRPRRVLVGEAAQDAHLDGGVADAAVEYRVQTVSSGRNGTAALSPRHPT